MDNFKCDTDQMEQMKITLSEIQDILSEVHNLGEKLQTMVESGDEWEGAANKTGAAFLALVVEFNRQLGSAAGGPVKEAYEGVGEYLDNDSVFYDEWTEYQEVKKI